MKNSIYQIRLALREEYPDLRDFLAENWGENHILVKSKEIFDFQYLAGDYYNVVVAYNTETSQIDVFWGIITTWKYDASLESNGDSWGALVKIRPNVNNSEIGGVAMKMLRWVLRQPQYEHFNHNGLGPKGRAFLMPYCAASGPLNQYYIANKELNEFHVASNPILSNYPTTDYDIQKVGLDTLESLPASTYKPKKTLTYILNRYTKHPIYNYFAWVVSKNHKVISVWILRKINVKDMGSVLRIVDVIGNIEEIGCIGNQVQKLLSAEGVEYVDFLNFGIQPNGIVKMGFEKLEVEGKTIIPNYFEPFEKKNIIIYAGLDSEDGYVIFKGDGDQDRPNMLQL